MTDNKRDMQQLAANLDEIKQLEEKIASLKRHLLKFSSKVLNDLLAQGESTPFLITVASGRRFAIPVAGIEEVIEMVSKIPLSDPIPGVIGLINYHGELIALFDLAEMAGLGKNSISEDNIIMICIMGDKRFGVMADETTDVVTVAKTHIRIADEVFSGMMREIAVIQVDKDIAAVVDLWSAVLALPLFAADNIGLPAADMNTLEKKGDS